MCQTPKPGFQLVLVVGGEFEVGRGRFAVDWSQAREGPASERGLAWAPGLVPSLDPTLGLPRADGVSATADKGLSLLNQFL